MCFWVGLEILILVYKQSVFLKYWTVSYLTLYPLRVEKKFLRNWACRVSKEAEFWADFKHVQKSRVWQKGKKILQKNWIFRDLEKIFGNFLTQEFYTFFKSVQNFASFDILQAQFRRNFFSTLIRGSSVFLEVKSSNKIETNQYFKKCFL